MPKFGRSWKIHNFERGRVYYEPEADDFKPGEKRKFLSVQFLASPCWKESSGSAFQVLEVTLPGFLARLNFPFNQDVLARAYAKLGNIDKAIEAYQKLLTFDPKGQDRRMQVPIYHYRLAKLYDAKGLKEQARAEYRKLLEDWKDADSGIPELTDANKRLDSSS
jgi:tetratricopeptide (TPR) repeat protein